MTGMPGSPPNATLPTAAPASMTATVAPINAGAAVRNVALYGNPGIPVMKGPGAHLFFDLFDPGVFPGGLVKMAMDNHITGGLAFGGEGLVCQGVIFPEPLVDPEFLRVKSILFRQVSPVNKSLGAPNAG